MSTEQAICKKHRRGKQQWDEMNNFGQAKAHELSLTEADVESIVQVVRQERLGRTSKDKKHDG